MSVSKDRDRSEVKPATQLQAPATVPSVPSEVSAPSAPEEPVECETGRLLLRWGTERGTTPPRSVVWLFESHQSPRRYLGMVRESEADTRCPWAARAVRVLTRLTGVDPSALDESLQLVVAAPRILMFAEADRLHGGWLFHDPEEVDCPVRPIQG